MHKHLAHYGQGDQYAQGKVEVNVYVHLQCACILCAVLALSFQLPPSLPSFTQLQFPAGAFDCWAYMTCNEAIQAIMVRLDADSLVSATPSLLLVRAELWRYALEKVREFDNYKISYIHVHVTTCLVLRVNTLYMHSVHVIYTCIKVAKFLTNFHILKYMYFLVIAIFSELVPKNILQTFFSHGNYCSLSYRCTKLIIICASTLSVAACHRSTVWADAIHQ